MIKDHFLLGRRDLKAKELRPLCTKLLKIPVYFAELIIKKIGKDSYVDQNTFLKFFRFKMYHKEPAKRCFSLLDPSDKGYLTGEDFWPLLRSILDQHAGLEFLKATPEFQDKYASTVIQRILFELDWDDDGKILYRDFKHSKLFPTLQRLENEEEINSIRDFFIYEHFYVIYCKFYELDLDHDEYISIEDFGKYNRHALSNKTINRIWS